MFERTKKIGKMKKISIHDIQWRHRIYNITVTNGYVTAVSNNILQWGIGVSWATVASWLEKKKAKIISVGGKETEETGKCPHKPFRETAGAIRNREKFIKPRIY